MASPPIPVRKVGVPDDHGACGLPARTILLMTAAKGRTSVPVVALAVTVAVATAPLLISSCSDRRGGDDDDVADGDADVDGDTDADGDAGSPALMSHMNPVNFGNSSPGAEWQDFDLILFNNGTGMLDITSIDVVGDVNCAMDGTPALDTGLPAHLGRPETAFLRIGYLPGGLLNATTGASDHIAIAIHSNSVDGPVYEVLVCGCIVEGDPGTVPPCPCSPGDVAEGSCAR